MDTESLYIEKQIIQGIEHEPTGVIKDTLFWLEEHNYKWSFSHFELILNSMNERQIIFAKAALFFKQTLTCST
jgi:hypothetical protein